MDCTQGYFSKHIHIFYLILSVTNINDKSQEGNTGFLIFSHMFRTAYAAVTFYLCLQINVQNAVVSIGKTELERERGRDKERERKKDIHYPHRRREEDRDREKERKRKRQREGETNRKRRRKRKGENKRSKRGEGNRKQKRERKQKRNSETPQQLGKITLHVCDGITGILRHPRGTGNRTLLASTHTLYPLTSHPCCLSLQIPKSMDAPAS